jgi:hypothetical protein
MKITFYIHAFIGQTKKKKKKQVHDLVLLTGFSF